MLIVELGEFEEVGFLWDATKYTSCRAPMMVCP
jgi:hypothetical protein